MQGKHLFEYAVIRIVPHVERDEFLNVGVVLYCSATKFLGCVYRLDEARICAFPEKPELAELEEYLSAFMRICKGGGEDGTIAALPTAERFRWLTATRSTVVQTSKVHPGFCSDPPEKLALLFRQLVL